MAPRGETTPKTSQPDKGRPSKFVEGIETPPPSKSPTPHLAGDFSDQGLQKLTADVLNQLSRPPEKATPVKKPQTKAQPPKKEATTSYFASMSQSGDSNRKAIEADWAKREQFLKDAGLWREVPPPHDAKEDGSEAWLLQELSVIHNGLNMWKYRFDTFKGDPHKDYDANKAEVDHYFKSYLPFAQRTQSWTHKVRKIIDHPRANSTVDWKTKLDEVENEKRDITFAASSARTRMSTAQDAMKKPLKGLENTISQGKTPKCRHTLIKGKH
jgi:hypothetical protein